MLDTKGPEIRTGILRDAEPIDLKEGQELDVLTDFSLEGDARRITISYQALPDTVKVGDKIVIDEGQLVLEVKECLEDSVKVIVMNDHTLGEHKNVALPGCQIDLPVLTERDEIDIYDFGFKENIDIVACSFTRKESDIEKISDFLGEKRSSIKIFAKIECKESLDNYEALLRAADGIIIARGDLSREIPSEKVFLAQKWMISEANAVGKPVIVSTEILESMVKKPRPTRAEAGDVAGIILDGVDCLMLTHETSIGKYPINATKMLVKICCEAEKTINYRRIYEDVFSKSKVPFKFSETVASSIANTALDLKIGVLIVFTDTGRAAYILAKYRPRQTIFVCTSSSSVSRQMNVVRGVTPILINARESVEECISRVIAYAKEQGMCADGSKAIVQMSSEGSGLKNDPAEECNMMKVYDI
uniref:Pyruvate kinase n=1 Tax=Euplotes harpa TaxID=151035 RepID=A0A7S3N8F7_9SPIT|mmetsp:Transcript_33547/g.38531  ORF Transcript_33547/g.38531 Transcript_33547/m.38531 type:complete len:418 (+) Transcript_33547:273-1526(+)